MERQREILEKIYYLDYLVKNYECDEIVSRIMGVRNNNDKTEIEKLWLEIVCYIKATNDNIVISKIRETQFLKDSNKLDGLKEIVEIVNTQPQQIAIPYDVLDWLEKPNVFKINPYIKDKGVKPLMWLQNVQVLRVLLTHKIIKGDLTIEEVKRRTKNLFVNKYNNPLIIISNDERQNNTQAKQLKIFLDSLEKHDISK